MKSQVAQAALRTAAYIEAHPTRYNFLCNDQPQGPDSLGCALGWLGHFLGVPSAPYRCYVNSVAKALGFWGLAEALDSFLRDTEYTDADFLYANRTADILRIWADRVEEDYISNGPMEA